MIGERRSAILQLIIDYYIKTGEPIGSKTLCQLLPYTVSSATIRNEMAYLSGIGFLEQRHTSGGRVPTKNSYRYYVDNLMQPKGLAPYEKQRIDEILSINAITRRLQTSAGPAVVVHLDSDLNIEIICIPVISIRHLAFHPPWA